MQTETGNNQSEPDPPKLEMRKFQGVALLYDGRGVNISGEAIDHITFLIRVTARLTEVPARVKELQIKDVTGLVIIPGLTVPMPRG